MGVWPYVTPQMPVEEQPAIGLIGMGAMGSLYARSFSEAGWKKIYICDLPDKYEALKAKYEGVPGIHVCPDGHRVSRVADYIMYSVEAEYIDRVVSQYGLSTKVGAVVSGQTSVKAPEKAAFEKYLPDDVHIVSCHSLHGPNVSTVGQPLVIIKHRAPDEAVTLVEHILAPLRSRYVYLSYEEHDIVTANTQAVTHAAFLRQATSSLSSSTPHLNLHTPAPLSSPSTPTTPSSASSGSDSPYSSEYEYDSSPESSPQSSPISPMTPLTPIDDNGDSMGTAWHCSLSYPWEHGLYVGGIETVKVNIMLRIYSNKWHVYAGLAILNPSARVQIDQFARSTSEIFKLMLASDAAGLRARIYAARAKVFGRSLDLGANGGHGDEPAHGNGDTNNTKPRPPIFLSEDILDRFSLGKKPSSARSPTSARAAPPNSHLSLLAMVDCWAALNIQPFEHLDLAATPIFRMWIGVAEYLFRSEARLDAAIHAALYETSHRSDDLEFVVAARGWSQCISFGNFELYKERFMHTSSFFESRFEEANKVGSAMIQALMDSSPEPKRA